MDHLFKRQTVIPKPPNEKEKIKKVAETEGWKLRKEVQASNHEPYQIQWATEDESVAFLYVEDDRIQAKGIEIRAIDLEGANTYMRSLMDIYSNEELKGAIRKASNVEEKILALHRTGLTQQPFDQEFFDLICAALPDKDDRIRIAALETIPYLKWRKFEPVLVKLSEDPIAGKFSAVMLKAMREHDWKEK